MTIVQVKKQTVAEKMTESLSNLRLKEGQDFRVSEVHGNRVHVQMNTGHILSSYRAGLQQVLKDTGYTLELSNTKLYVKERKKKPA